MIRVSTAIAALALILTFTTSVYAQRRCTNASITNAVIRGDLIAENCTMINTRVSGTIRFRGTNNFATTVRAGGNIKVLSGARLTASDLHARRDILSASATDISISNCTAGGNIEINRTRSLGVRIRTDLINA